MLLMPSCVKPLRIVPVTAAGRGRREESQIPNVWWGWYGFSSTVLLGRSKEWEGVTWGKVRQVGTELGGRENNEGVSGDLWRKYAGVCSE